MLRESEIAARIRYFMERAGLRPARLAEACGVSPGSVSEWLAGNTEPTHENLARIAKACGVTLADLWALPVVVVQQRAAEG